MSVENTIEWLKKNPIVLLFSVFLVVLSSLTTLVEGGGKIFSMYKKTIGHNAEIDKKLNSLNVEVDIGYFNGVLGSPAIKNTRTLNRVFYSFESFQNTEKPKKSEEEITYKEYFYIDEDYYVQAVADEDNKVGMYSITARSGKYIPEIESDLGETVYLGRSAYSEMKDKPRKVAGLIGMNLKHFNYYEVFLFDPGNYRHVIYSSNPNGHFENVGSIGWEISEVFARGFSVDSDDFPMHQKHKDFRSDTTINTYSVTASWFKGIDLTNDGINYGGAKINFGPHVDQVSMIK